MSIGKPEQFNENIRGRVAPIFLTYEPEKELSDLFKYSQEFHAKHTVDAPVSKEALPHGFGTIAVVRQLDNEGKRTLPPHECIAFDARQPDGYVWDISYSDAGAQQVARLWVAETETQGIFARTDPQGRLMEIFDILPWDVFAIEKHLRGRLASEEVEAAIKEAYVKRENIMATRVRMVNESRDEILKYAQAKGLPIQDVEPNTYYNNQIALQDNQLKITGFTPMMLFNPKWLETEILY